MKIKYSLYVLFCVIIIFSCTKPKDQTNYSQNSVEVPNDPYSDWDTNWRDEFVSLGTLENTVPDNILDGEIWIITEFWSDYAYQICNDTLFFYNNNKYDIHTHTGEIFESSTYNLTALISGQAYNFVLRDLPSLASGSGDWSGTTSINSINNGEMFIDPFVDENTGVTTKVKLIKLL